jgi:hypothetical protein
MAKKDEFQNGTINDPFVDVVANYLFHNFELTPKFTGTYVNTVTLGEDEENKFLANIFVNIETGEIFYLSNAYSIEKAIRLAKEKYNSLNGVVFKIVFLGKIDLKGKPFNQFRISTCTIEEYNNFVKE